MATAEQATPATSAMPQAWLDLQSDIDVYARAIIDLKSRQNTHTRIGSLPPELLSEILVRVMMDDYLESSKSYYNRLPWIRLTHVCRHFRAVALSTPHFWSHLRLTKSEVFAELLTHSKSVPLHIKARVDGGSRHIEYTMAVAMLLPHSHRIQHLHIEGPAQLIQLFCSKTVFPFDALEKLELTSTSNHYGTYALHLPAVLPVFASSTAPPRLHHLELRKLPFCWTDPIFASPTLTTLVVIGYDGVGDRVGASLRSDVGSFDALFSALEAAVRLEALTIEDAIPKEGLVVTDPVQLPLPSRIIPLPSLKHIRLAGDAIYVAHLLNHISSPPTTPLNITLRDPTELGSKELARSIAAHMSERPPLLSLRLTETGRDAYNMFCRTHLGTSGGAALQVTCGSLRDHLYPLLSQSGTLFANIQELRVSGTFASAGRNWGLIFGRFPRLRTLVLPKHPPRDMLSSLSTVRQQQNGRSYIPAPSLRVLHLSGFYARMFADGLEPFNDLLDLVIFRCNWGIPIEEIRLPGCKYATVGHVDRLKEVVLDVEYTMDETDSDGELDDYDYDYGWGGLFDDVYPRPFKRRRTIGY